MSRISVDSLAADRPELLRVLSQRYSNDANLFTISRESLTYPWLNAYVRNDLAVLYYLPTEGEMFASANGMEWDGKKRVEFYDNDVSVNDLPASQVISWSSALSCIEEFCDNLMLPTGIDWDRLS